MTWRGSTAVAATAVLFISACGSESGATDLPSPPADTSSATEAMTTEPAAEVTEDSVVAEAEANVADRTQFPTDILTTGSFDPVGDAVIYNIACNQALVGCSVIAGKIREAVEALGWEYRLCDAGADPQTATSCFNQAINGGADGIVTNAVGTNVAGNGYAAAAEADIPIVAIFSGNQPGADGVIAEVGEEACAEQGSNVADFVMTDTDGAADVLLVFESSIGCNVQRADGFMERIGQCQGCSAERLQFEISTMENNLPRQLLAEIQANPQLTYVVGVFGAATQTAHDAVLQSGRDIRVAGLDSDPAIVQIIEDGGAIKGSVAFGRGEAAWAAVDTMARHLSGESVEAEIPVQQLLITGDNVTDLPDEGFDGAEGYQDQFRELWGVG